jgi:quinol monooxygenase YgiN
MSSTNDIVVLARIQVQPGKEAAFIKAFLSTAPISRAEAGCLAYEINVDQTDSARFVVYERWADRDALRAHIKSPHMQPLLGEMPGLITADSPPLQKLRSLL